MRRSLSWLSVPLALLALLIIQSVAADPPPQVPDPAERAAAPPATVPSRISYQGRLTDPAGAPLNGAYNMVYQVWTDSAAGAQVGADVVLNAVPVNDGLFTVQLDLPQSEIYGQALWLAVQVNGQWLSPRQQLLPVPYALSLRPGARVEAASATTNLTLANSGGLALSAAGQRGVEATGIVTGVLGIATARGGRGVAGFGDNYSAVGVYGLAGFGTGVEGDGEIGVRGTSHLGSGIRGEGPTGVSGKSTVSGGYGLYTADNLYVGGHCVGCKLALLALNSGDQPVAPGDVVSLAGIAPSPVASATLPILAVRRADTGDGVPIGVVSARYLPTTDGRLADQSAAQGEHLVIVAEGVVRVRVDAGPAQVKVGDALALATGSARMRKVGSTAVASHVVAYALEPLSGGDSLIWALLLQR